MSSLINAVRKPNELSFSPLTSFIERPYIRNISRQVTSNLCRVLRFFFHRVADFVFAEVLNFIKVDAAVLIHRNVG